MMWNLSLAVAGCYAAVQFHLFKPSDVLGTFLKCVGGNPAYVDAEYEVLFLGPNCEIVSSAHCDRSGVEIPFI